MSITNRQNQRFCAFLILFLSANLLIVPSSSSSSPSVSIHRQTWFECGLLYCYPVQQFIHVLTEFDFDSVIIDPFKLDPSGFQTEICNGTYELCDAVDLYAQEHPSFLKFLIVGGGGTYINQALVENFRNRGYITVMDDSGTNVTATRTNLQHLKSSGFQTGLVHQYWEGAKQLINEGLVNYSMPCFYPYFSDVDNTGNLTSQFNDMSTWCNGKCEFLPAIQIFGLYNPSTNVRWRFPSHDEIQAMLNFLAGLNPWGLTWFLPHSGKSERGEIFEGFLNHSEVRNIIMNPQNKELAFCLPKEVLIALIVLILTLPFAVYIRNRHRQKAS